MKANRSSIGSSLRNSKSTRETQDSMSRVFTLARHVLDGRHPGVFTTLTKDGCPRSRWMATISFLDFPIMYALTSPVSRKLSDLQAHPEACWLFANEDLSVTFTLIGSASEVFDPYVVKDVWNSIADKSLAYFLRFAPSVSVIGTQVREIECQIPSRNFTAHCAVEEMTAALRSGAEHDRRQAG